MTWNCGFLYLELVFIGDIFAHRCKPTLLSLVPLFTTRRCKNNLHRICVTNSPFFLRVCMMQFLVFRWLSINRRSASKYLHSSFVCHIRTRTLHLPKLSLLISQKGTLFHEHTDWSLEKVSHNYTTCWGIARDSTSVWSILLCSYMMPSQLSDSFIMNCAVFRISYDHSSRINKCFGTVSLRNLLCWLGRMNIFLRQWPNKVKIPTPQCHVNQ